MTAAADDSLAVSSWLADLRMECYKKNLENYDTVKLLLLAGTEGKKSVKKVFKKPKGLLELKEGDIKKLGVVNSKDRSRMMSSLASYRTNRGSTITPIPATQITQIQESHKSLLRKGSLRKLNIKSLLGNSGSKKSKNSKKVADSNQITESPLVSTVSEIVDELTIPVVGSIGLAPPSAPSSNTSSNSSLNYSLPPPPPEFADKPSSSSSSAIADYEELPDDVHPLTRSATLDGTKTLHVAQRYPAVENEYVPSPENSPQFGAQRMRANTSAGYLGSGGGNGTGSSNYSDHTHWYIQHSGVAPHLQHSVNSTPELVLRPRPGSGHHHAPSEASSNDSPGQVIHKHLSVVSMESGLSFGYDVEKDFNPALPLETQPWFHGKIIRGDAEMLLHDDGDFLVRENTTMANTYTLTLRWRGVADHTLIGTTEVVNTTAGIKVGTKIKYEFDSGAFDSIPELIYNHLKYQIPVDKSQHTLITNPICRAGGSAKSSMYASFGAYSSSQRSNGSPDSSPAFKGRSASPQDQVRASQMLRLSKTMSVSPYASPRDTPPRQVEIGGTVPHHPRHARLSRHMSSGDLLESSKEDIQVALRNVISPPPDTGSRTMTFGEFSRRGSDESYLRREADETEDNHKRMDSFGDYEVMESVSLFGDSPTGPRKMSPIPPQVQNLRTIQRPFSADASRRPQMAMMDSTSLDRPNKMRERVKYAEIRYAKNQDEVPRPVIKPGQSINYAEVRFSRANTVSGTPSPLYDVVPPGRREASPQATPQSTAVPYQSRAEVLAQKMRQNEPNYATPNTLALRQSSGTLPPRSSSVNYSTVILPHQNLTPSAGSASTLPPHATLSPSTALASNSSSAISSLQEPPLYAMPKKVRPHSAAVSQVRPQAAAVSQDLSSSNDSLLSATSSSVSTSPASKRRVMGSSLVHSHTPSTKVHRNLPGYEALVKAHTILQSHTNEELAYHMTRTDAVCFMLAPRPGEDKSIWRERTAQVTASSGMLCGLQTLADPSAGEALWKKLYHRHLSLSQTVTLTIITAGDAMERVKLLRRYIIVAHLLQSPANGNLFSFMAVMHGLATPQLTGMADLWQLLQTNHPEDMATYESLQGVLSSLEQGYPILSLDDLVIPAIQPLKELFHFSDPFAPVPSPPQPMRQELATVREFSDMASKMDFLRDIVAGTARMTVNAWHKLQDLQYNFNLVEFFSQDFTRSYLQSMSVVCDDPVERRRRCNLLMDALIDRVESSEAV